MDDELNGDGAVPTFLKYANALIYLYFMAYKLHYIIFAAVSNGGRQVALIAVIGLALIQLLTYYCFIIMIRLLCNVPLCS